MSQKIDPNKPMFKNTFLPRCRSKYLSVNALVSFVKLGLCSLADIPPDVKKHVVKEMQIPNT